MSSRRVREKLREAKIARDVALEKSRRESDLMEQEKKDLTPKKKTAKSKNRAPHGKETNNGYKKSQKNAQTSQNGV